MIYASGEVTYYHNPCIQVKEFFQKKLQQENLRVVSQALDSIKMNIDWRRRNEQMLIDWLKSHAVWSRSQSI